MSDKKESTIGMISRLSSNNPSAFGIVAAKEIAGHKTVKVKTDLYTLSDAILSLSQDNTDDDAIGQIWYVAQGEGGGKHYKLINWSLRRQAAGWEEFTTGGGGASDELSNKVQELEVNVDSLEAWKTTVDGQLNSFTTESEVEDIIERLVGGSPDALEALKELAAALKENPDIVENLENIAASKADKTVVDALDKRVETIEDGLSANNTLVRPTITPNWAPYKNDGTTAVPLDSINLNTGTDKTKNPKVEYGYKFGYSATYTWTSDSSKREPESMAAQGSNFTKLTESGQTSDPITHSALLTDNSSLTVKYVAEKRGYQVSDNLISPASGNIEASDTASITFVHKRYYGLTTISDATAAAVTDLEGSGYMARGGENFTTESLTTKGTNYRYMYASPVRLKTIVADTTTVWKQTAPTEGSFVEKEVRVTNSAGANITYYTYLTGSYGNLDKNVLTFNHK